jgi:hypothetical protein
MGKKPIKYHSSLTEPERAPSVSRLSVGHSIAFVADINDGLPSEYSDCDIIYSEIAWRRTFSVFAERAGVASSYEGYIKSIAVIAEAAMLGNVAPTIIVCGKTEEKRLPKPTERIPVNLNTGGRFITEAIAIAYGSELPRLKPEKWENSSTVDLLSAIANKYSRVGDFCCGYGNSGIVFCAHGKSFVMSDFDPKCIGHIKQSLQGDASG